MRLDIIALHLIYTTLFYSENFFLLHLLTVYLPSSSPSPSVYLLFSAFLFFLLSLLPCFLYLTSSLSFFFFLYFLSFLTKFFFYFPHFTLHFFSISFPHTSLIPHLFSFIQPPVFFRNTLYHLLASFPHLQLLPHLHLHVSNIPHHKFINSCCHLQTVFH